MPLVKEIDIVALLKPVTAQILGETNSVIIPSGAKGTVVMVYDVAGTTEALEVEFPLGEESSALATVPYGDVALVWSA